MFSLVSYPVSCVLWGWHQAFGLLLGESSAIGWVAAIVFLVFSLRAILLLPAIKQARAVRAIQQFAPQLKALQQRYARDSERQAAELRRLQAEHGVRPLAGCLLTLVQLPVFIGLNRVLRGFTQQPIGPNYFFSLHGVHSYLSATLFGAHLSDAIVNIGLFGGRAAPHALWMWQVAPIAIPLIIAAAVATHLTARLSQRYSAGGTQPAARLAMWVFPFGVLAFGAALPVGLLVYWVSNNAWTLGQQHLVFRHLDATRSPSDHGAQLW